MIVSMATEEYLNYLHIMLSSLLRFNPDYQVTINLINCRKEKKQVLEKEFPKVNFKDHTGEFNLKPNNNPGNQKKVLTYLKGVFIAEESEKNDKVIWIDATALIRNKIDEIYNALEIKGFALVKRNNNNDRFTYAAEIIAMNSQNKNIIQNYKQSCIKLKNDWYADQKSLHVIPKNNIYYLKFGDYCNFTYQRHANTWSDRGRTGKGNLTSDDDRYTTITFLNEMERFIPNYTTKHKEFMNKIYNADPRLKVLVFTDDYSWCYTNTVKEVVENLKDEISFTVVSNATNERHRIQNWQGDLVWCRCDSGRAKKLYAVRSDLKQISYSSITIGGELLHERVNYNLHSQKGEKGVIAQNQEAEFLLEYNNHKNVYILPNGINTEKFKYTETPREFIVGFAGRNKRPEDDDWKGYNKYVVPVVKKLNLKLLEANNMQNLYTYEDMPKFYEKISVLVLLSKAEGCSNTIFEAQSSGVPVITTRTGWHFENCTDYENIIFCSRNLIDLEKKILELKDDKKLYEKIKKNGRKFAEKHDWKEVSKHYLKKLKQMAK